MDDMKINVTDFKAKCLSLLDDIGQHGGTVTITKRGRSIATVGPAAQPAWKSPEGMWAGKVEIMCDLANLDTADLWEVVREN